MRKYYEKTIDCESICKVFTTTRPTQLEELIKDHKSYDFQFTEGDRGMYTIIFTKNRYFLAGVEREPTIFEKIRDKIFDKSE